MISLNTTAQQVMDEFYQQVKSDEDFLDLGFFQSECISARNKLLEDEYKEMRKMDIALQGEDYDLTMVGGEWVEQFQAKVEFDKDTRNHFAVIPVKIFAFPYDRWTMGVQSIIPLGQCEGLERIRLNMDWATCAFDVTQDAIWWYVQGDKIIFKNLDFNCIKKVILNLIPSYDDCSENCYAPIPDGKESMVMDMVVDSAFKAWMRRYGKIDYTSNQNNNQTNEQAPVNSLAN